MKKLLLPLVVVALLAGAFAAGPFLAISQIREAADQHDAAALDRHVDFPVLRENLKSQFKSAMMEEMELDATDNPFAALAAGFASSLIDGMVEVFITPDMVIEMLKGRKPDLDKAGRQQSSGGKADAPMEGDADKEALKDASFRFDSLGKFSATVTDEDGRTMVYVLSRYGLQWKLTNILIDFSH